MKNFMIRNTNVLLSIIVFVSLMAFSSTVIADEMAFEKLWSRVQKEGVLKVGVASAAPHCIKDPMTGEWSGVAINVLRKLADVLEVKIEFQDTTWDNIIAGLLANKWDIAPALNERPRRALVVNYSIPFYFYQLDFLYNKDNPKLKGASKFEDFDKLEIKGAVVAGTAEDKTITSVAKNMKIVRLPSNQETRMAVVSGRADFLMGDGATNYLTYLANKEWAAIYTPDPPLAREGCGFAFRKSVSLEEVQVLDILIKECRNSGLLRQWEEELGTKIIKELKDN